MIEILPAVHHWATLHPRVGIESSCYRFADQGVLVDPLVPDEHPVLAFDDADAVLRRFVRRR